MAENPYRSPESDLPKRTQPRRVVGCIFLLLSLPLALAAALFGTCAALSSNIQVTNPGFFILVALVCGFAAVAFLADGLRRYRQNR